MAKYELNLRDYWRIIQRRRSVILISFLGIVFIAFFYTLSLPKVYQSSATVKIEERKTVAGLLLESLMTWGPGDILTTEANVIKSWPVAERAAKIMKLIDDEMSDSRRYNIILGVKNSISTHIIPDTNLIEIIASSNSPKKSANIANAVSKAYLVENRNQRQRRSKQVREFIEQQLKIAATKLKEAEGHYIDFREHSGASGIAGVLETRIADLKEKLAGMESKYTPKHPFVIKLRKQIAELNSQLQHLPSQEVQLARLRREFEVAEKNYNTLKEKLEEAKITEAGNVGEAVVINPAVVSHHPVGTPFITNIFLGILLGVVISLMSGFVVETLDTSIGAIEDVESLLHLPVLAVIPHIQEKNILTLKDRIIRLTPFYRPSFPEIREKRMVSHFNPGSPSAEGYKVFRTNLKISPKNKVILITSTVHEEGKTSAAVNLAITLAQSRIKTLLIGCDFRRPSLAKTFGLKGKDGLSDVLTGVIDLDKATYGITHFMMGQLGWEKVMKTPGLDNLFLIPEGKNYSQPSELLSSAKTKDLFNNLRTKYQAIIIDSPPILAVTDALILAPLADSVVIVYQAGRAQRASLVRAKNMLEQTGAKIIGVLLNHVKSSTEPMDQNYPYYKYSYSSSQTAE